MHIGEQLERRIRVPARAEAELHLASLISAPGCLTQANVVPMPAKRGNESRHIVKLASGVGQPRKIFEVHANPVLAIQKQARFDNAAPKERGSRWNVAAEVHKDGGIEAMLDFGAHDLSVAVHKDTIAVDDIGLRVLLGCTSDSFEPAGQVVVVSI